MFTYWSSTVSVSGSSSGGTTSECELNPPDTVPSRTVRELPLLTARSLPPPATKLPGVISVGSMRVFEDSTCGLPAAPLSRVKRPSWPAANARSVRPSPLKSAAANRAEESPVVLATTLW